MAIALTLTLVPISMIDADTQLIPDSIVLPLMWVGLAMSLFHPIQGAETLFIGPTLPKMALASSTRIRIRAIRNPMSEKLGAWNPAML